jgi:hypothetical protein
LSCSCGSEQAMDTLRSFSSPTTSIYDPDVTSLVARSERNPG